MQITTEKKKTRWFIRQQPGNSDPEEKKLSRAIYHNGMEKHLDYQNAFPSPTSNDSKRSLSRLVVIKNLFKKKGLTTAPTVCT